MFSFTYNQHLCRHQKQKRCRPELLRVSTATIKTIKAGAKEEREVWICISIVYISMRAKSSITILKTHTHTQKTGFVLNSYTFFLFPCLETMALFSFTMSGEKTPRKRSCSQQIWGLSQQSRGLTSDSFTQSHSGALSNTQANTHSLCHSSFFFFVIFILVALPGCCVTAMPYQCCLQAEPESRGGATAKRAFLCCSSRMPCAGKVHISAYQYDRTLKRLRCFYLAGTESVIVFAIQPARFLKCKYTGTHAHAQYTL